MTTDTDIIRQLRDALRSVLNSPGIWAKEGAEEALAAADARLSAAPQAGQAPVAYLYHDGSAPHGLDPLVHSMRLVLAKDRQPHLKNETPLYAAPQASEPAAPAAPKPEAAGSLLRKPVKSIQEISAQIPGGCYCQPGTCSAPVIMGRQTPCLRREDQTIVAPGAGEVTPEQDIAVFGGSWRKVWRGTDGKEVSERIHPSEVFATPTPPADIVRDAERYRWLQGNYSGLLCSDRPSGSHVSFSESLNQPTTFFPSMLDAAIDAAIAASKGA